MDLTLTDSVVRADAEARERFYDSRGYGRPVDAGALELAPVEAAHLLYRGDLDAVDGMNFRAFLASATVSEIEFLVYKNLRDRGFYLTPAIDGWVDDPDRADFVVYPRGKGPWDDEVQYRVRVVSERATVAASDLGDVVLAVVDEESELTYLETERPDLSGSSEADLPSSVDADLLSDRALVWDPPAELYEQAFYGQRLDDQREGDLQLSLLEAAYLARRGVLSIDGGDEAVVARGREVEGDRFDRRLRVYATLRDRGVVPKTGFKFGADFRTYAHVESVDDLGHSEHLVRVFAREHTFDPRDLALDVRLAHGVRKRMVYALTGPEESTWLTVSRLTP
ncbi:tRNA-intron lyase [Haloarculaceae archaeon H-GB2-1]|nr:tRNA-intron lyase [Haloarculaceae archaeon H-GB1-1]MEA5387811.1 tRNA-intron lyase [Haloarculaceae archaeon H-GB11]MEA5409310.1 tRNA-intron lyase [Haloarculaceae archaeon H-GB2-1]